MKFNQWVGRGVIFIPIVLGVIIVLLAPKLKSPPQKNNDSEFVTKVRFINPLFQEVSPKVLGYGISEPSKNWEMVAEVSGRITWVSEDLKEGNIIVKGTKLLTIDDSEYKLALRQVDAQIHMSKVHADTTRQLLAIEQRSQSLFKKEISRQRKLKEKGLLAASVLEIAERDLIKADVILQGLKNTLSINIAERETLQVQREQAELDLARTQIIAPFDVRIVNIDAFEAQFANKGQLLFSADATDKTEIEARFPIGQLRPLIASKRPNQSEKHPGALGLEAIVRLRTSTHDIEWQAKVDRVGGQIDRQTQTLGVIVVVDDPYGKARPGERPPLIRNTFVEVELRGQPKGKQLIVPIFSIHENKIYLLDKENRLDIRKVKIAFTQDRYAVLVEGITAKDKLIVSDLMPAVQGMLLKPIADKKTRNMLIMEVLGQESPVQKNKEQKDISK